MSNLLSAEADSSRHKKIKISKCKNEKVKCRVSLKFVNLI